VTMLGHSTGRLLLARDGYPVDLDAVLAAASKAGTMIEINANPHRLDLDSPHCRKAKALGITLVINPDAHATGGFDDLHYGIGVARRAGLEAADVFNTRPLDQIASALAQHKQRATAAATSLS
jgi:DNA polymerase (family X)